jgi:ATP synthase protein I
MTALPAASAASSPSAPFAWMLRGALRPTVLCSPVVIGALWAARGGAGGLAALLGSALAVAFFWAGLFVMTRLVGDNPISLLAAALAVYLGQVLVLGVVIFTLSGAAWLDGPAFGLAVLAVALLWQVFQVRAFVRARKSVYDVPAAPATTPAPAPDGQGPS